MGTLAYMPPEQALGEVDRLDERADVFALGAILSEILTGKPPYVAQDSSALHRLATRGKLDDCFVRLDTCEAEPEVIELAKACLCPELEDRPRNAAVVATKVAEYHDSLQQRLRDAELQKVASETKASEERRRHKLYLAICMLLLAVGTGAVIAAGGFWSLSQTNKLLVVEKEIQRKDAEEARQSADNEAQMAKVKWLATESRALQGDRPSQSILLAIEAVQWSQQHGASLLPVAHEALLNSTQNLGGRPLRGHSENVTAMSMSVDRLVSLGGGTVRIWDLMAIILRLLPECWGTTKTRSNRW